MTKLEIIESYLKAYNNFDVEEMIRNVHEKVRFRNMSNGEVNLETQGIAAFKAQADKAVKLFREREQRITDLQEQGDMVEVSIDYTGILAVDFSDYLKAGSEIRLQGKSLFGFRDGKIISVEDIS